jgi:hypothetical protein
MRDIAKILAYAILAGIVGTIVFVRAGQLGGKNGGEQASKIINSTAKGFASIINAASGYEVKSE